MKKNIILCLVLSLILIGCSHKKTETKLNDETRLESYFPDEKKKTDKNPNVLSEEEISDGFELPIEPIDKAQFPFAVGVESIVKLLDQGENRQKVVEGTDFISSGINSPSQIRIGEGSSPTLGVCVVMYPSKSGTTQGEVNPIAEYPIVLKQIPTKEISVFSAAGNNQNKRTIKVNTEVILQENSESLETSQPYADLSGHKFYLFYNAKGTISLATENFAGNIGPEDRDTMMEYVEK